MRRFIAILAVLLVVACGVQYVSHEKNAPSAPDAISVTRDPQMASYAPGDTLLYTIAWSAGARAQGYLVTTTVTQGTGWSGMLTNAPTVALSIPFRPINTTAWDSVTFQACVVSTAPGKVNSPSRCTSWKLVRGPGTPGTPTVDSSQVIASFDVKPDGVALYTNASQQFCPFVKALDGKWRFIAGYEVLPYCQGQYDTYPTENKLPGYPVAYSRTPYTIQMPSRLVVVTTPQKALASIIFAGPFV